MVYKCSHCGQEFTHSYNMKRHIKSKHMSDNKAKCDALKHPFSLLSVGPSNSEKTRSIQQLHENRFIEPFPTRILWCYSQWQDAYDQLKEAFPSIVFVKGLPKDIMERWHPSNNNILVLDDLMGQMRIFALRKQVLNNCNNTKI